MRCFMTGGLVNPVSTHPKIEKLSDVGGLPTGDVLIGFDKDAFRSYGLEQAANASLSEESAAVYSAALNFLIKNHSRRLAGAKVVHWFKKRIPAADDPYAFLEEATGPQGANDADELHAQHKAAELLDAIRSGRRPDLAGNHYYALTLSGASGRVMVRDWMEGQFEELAGNVAIWFKDLAIVHREGGHAAPAPKFLAVLGSTVRSLDDLPAPFVAKMWRVAVKDEPIPLVALAKALARAKVDLMQNEPANHARMGLIKAYHIRKAEKEGDKEMAQELRPYLNEGHPSPAYQCGRLLAVLAALQRSALGDVGAGVIERYYAAASATPALVLGRLVRTSHFHLAKLSSPGLAHWYESKSAAIWGQIMGSVPRTLTLEEQSLFALGYYQQMADLRTKKTDASNPEKEQTNG